MGIYKIDIVFILKVKVEIDELGKNKIDWKDRLVVMIVYCFCRGLKFYL